MNELNKFKAKELKPDPEKILYFLSNCKEGRSNEVRIEEVLGMAKYIVNNKLTDEYFIELSRLKIIIHKTLGISINISRRRINRWRMR